MTQPRFLPTCVLASTLFLSACSMTNYTNVRQGNVESATSDETSNNQITTPVTLNTPRQLVALNNDPAPEIFIVEAQPQAPDFTLPVTTSIPMTANRIVEQRINDLLTRQRAVLSIYMERGDKWFPMIEKIFAEEGIPDELKYLALVESNLNPRARSHARAVGMWQFIAGTARTYDLQITPWIDERMDPEKATRAAAIHFVELYESYNQNWELALAGYNCSYRCISRAVRKAGSSFEEKPSYWEIYPYLPYETRQFIPKFIASALLISNPSHYGLKKENQGEEFSYDSILVKGPILLEQVAELSASDVKIIRSLNPALRRDSLPPVGEDYELHLPSGSAAGFIHAFNQLPKSGVTSVTEYVVKSGDTLGKIANQFDLSIAELQSANNVRGHLIYPRQKLLIPGDGYGIEVSLNEGEVHTVNYGLHPVRPIELGTEYDLVSTKGKNDTIRVTVSLNSLQEEPIAPLIHRISRGETLGQIARQYGVRVSDIQMWNNLRGTRIVAGKELTMHSTVNPTATAVQVASYEVRKNDNLGAIARKFGVSVDKLKNKNGLNSNTIYPGQILQLGL